MLRPGHNCWKIARADRFVLLIDGANYYHNLAAAFERARRSIAVVGWDLDTRIRLFQAAHAWQRGPRLRHFLQRLVRRNRDLNIYILNWNFPLIFANARDPNLLFDRPFRHSRIQFQFDNTHAAGASHHQKIVVVDDGLAFAGGMDIAAGRWDTQEHRAHDSRRSSRRDCYPPSHDVQAMMDGDAAHSLAEIVRDRWRRATGDCMPDVRSADIWPSAVQPDVTNVDVAISRTDRQNGHDQQIENLHLDLIAAAREFIYIENQYLTSELIVAALGERLQQIDGPEILIVLPLNNFGWLEAHTIEILRVRSIQRLRQMDRFHRLRIMCPVVPDMDGRSVGVHSKLLIVDDRLMRIGSSNLTNRSMRVDTECDLTIEAHSAAKRIAVAGWRNRLLAEHLGMSEKQVRDFLSSERSLLRLVDSRRGHARYLREIPDKHSTEEMVLGAELADPHKPLTANVVIEALATSVKQQPVRRLLPLALAFGGAAAVLTLVVLRRR